MAGLILAACSAGPTTVGGVSGHAKIVYSFTPQLDDAATTAAAGQTPTLISEYVTAKCPQGQKVLAGGFNLDGLDAVNDWQVAHPEPTNARPDPTMKIYHPVATLLRVVATNPLPDLSGWEIHVSGVVVPPSTDRPITAYAYCAAGLSTPPVIERQDALTDVSGTSFITMTCPTGTVISGAGYTDGTFFDGSEKAYLPIYSGFPESTGSKESWVVSPDLTPTYSPPPSGVAYEGSLVCVSAQDFSVITPPGGNFTLKFNPSVATTTTKLGDYTVYFLHHHEASTCPAGTLLLPPAFDFALTLEGMDIRIDAAWVELGLDSWSLDVSTGGGVTYPTGDFFSDGPTAFVRCLQPA